MVYPLFILYNIIKEMLIKLMEQTVNSEGSPYLACKEKRAFSLLNNLKDINCVYDTPYYLLDNIFWTIYSCTPDKDT